MDNTHEVAQRVAPDARVVYVDNDPLVLAHARALLTSTPEGATSYLDTDMREPDRIVAGAADFLDLDRPVGLLFMGVLGHLADVEEARTVVRGLLAPLAPGSYLAACDGVFAGDFEVTAKAQEEYNDSGADAYHMRSHEEVRSYFDGVQPGGPGLRLDHPLATDADAARQHDRCRAAGGAAVVRRGRPEALKCAAEDQDRRLRHQTSVSDVCRSW